MFKHSFSAFFSGDTIERVGDLLLAVEEIRGQWRDLCTNLLRDNPGKMNELIHSSNDRNNMMECLHAYYDGGASSWTEVVRAVGTYPVNNKRVAKKIAVDHNLNFDEVMK